MESKGRALAIAALMEQLTRQVQNICFTKDLAPVQWSALRFFARVGRAGRTASGLAGYSGVNMSSASRTIKLLHQKNLVAIEADAEDNRVRRVTLTGPGYELLERDPLTELAGAVQRLAGDDQDALRNGLEKVLFELYPKPFKKKPTT